MTDELCRTYHGYCIRGHTRRRYSGFHAHPKEFAFHKTVKT